MKKTYLGLIACVLVNVCYSQQNLKQENIEKPVFSMGITGGVAITSMKFKVPFNSFYASTNKLGVASFHQATSPVLGIFTSFNLSEKGGLHAAGLELMYHAYKYNSDSISILTEKGAYHFSLAYLRSSLFYRYSYTTNQFDLSALVGFTFGMNMKLEHSYQYKNGNNIVSEGLGLAKPANDIGFLVGVGTMYKRIGVDLRYYNTNPFTNNTNLNFKTRASSFILLFRYSIFNQ